MSITIAKNYSRDKAKIYYKIEFGRGAGQRLATGIFTYAKPVNQIQKDYNKEALKILELKKSQMVLDAQTISSGYIPQHKYKSNFFDYYEEFVKLNKRYGNRHLECSLAILRDFVDSPVLSPSDITENFCKRFRQYLLDKFNGETPMNYFGRFKRVVKAAAKDGYYRHSPAEDVKAKTNRNVIIKDIIDKQGYLNLINTPCSNEEIKKAFIFSLYTGLRWADVQPLKWSSIKDDSKTFSILQKKTGVPLERPLHDLARNIIGERKEGLVFNLPTQDGANKVLKAWAKKAGILKHITWHCARHSFSVLLQEEGIDTATVAGMLGHTSTKFVQRTYQRFKQVNAKDAINKLPVLVFKFK
ncbi:MAG: site-specific integrase [Sediminibacterium sp.]